MTTDQEFADYLRGALRRLSEEEVAEIERRKDAERGKYVPAGEIVHHCWGEARDDVR